VHAKACVVDDTWATIGSDNFNRRSWTHDSELSAVVVEPDRAHGDRTTGTDGCIKNFGGNPIAGTCSSDRRFKKDITPFDHVLDRVTGLQPVHYFWRASEFPDRQFGNRRAYGLVAQDVESILPELVVTNADGFKAVDYSELPLLTIQAVKELRSKVEELNTENDTLKQRLAELERQVSELLPAPRR